MCENVWENENCVVHHSMWLKLMKWSIIRRHNLDNAIIQVWLEMLFEVVHRYTVYLFHVKVFGVVLFATIARDTSWVRVMQRGGEDLLCSRVGAPRTPQPLISNCPTAVLQQLLFKFDLLFFITFPIHCTHTAFNPSKLGTYLDFYPYNIILLFVQFKINPLLGPLPVYCLVTIYTYVPSFKRI